MPRVKTSIVAAGVVATLTLAILGLMSGCELSMGQAMPPVTFVADPLEIELFEVEYEPETVSLTLHLPTPNDALLRGDHAAFYQALPTTVPGLRPQGWMGGQYGFVRNPARTPVGPTFTRVHQGIDIRPVRRDRNGEPLDTVRTVSDGVVAYVNRGANASNYGRYLVVGHDWDDSTVYTLYAHLAEIWVRPGQELAGGEPVGRMGYTGRGINRATAHLHFEVTLMLNSAYQSWHGAFYASRNLHGSFSGLNLRGIDPSALYMALQDDPALTFAEFVRSRPVAYRIALPGNRPLDILNRYPWLAAEDMDRESPGAWVVSFTREGVPVQITRQSSGVARPTVLYVAEEIRRNHLSTGGHLARGPNGFALTRNGNGYMALLATSGGAVPSWF